MYTKNIIIGLKMDTLTCKFRTKITIVYIKMELLIDFLHLSCKK